LQLGDGTDGRCDEEGEIPVKNWRAEGLRMSQEEGVANGVEIPFIPSLENLRGYFTASKR
jgi:hypothetical protein